MNEVQQAVIDYVSTPQTDYALLITGPWGCGPPAATPTQA